jgi:hypothetical protein
MNLFPDSIRSWVSRDLFRDLAWVLGGLAWVSSPAAVGVDFQREIRPLLVENCLACHGPDEAARKAGLRLDTRAGLLETTRRRDAAVVPGDPENSPLWLRVVSEDPDDVMPPPASHKTLEAGAKEQLRQWILEGAEWEEHWSFTAPRRPEVPAVGLPAGAVVHPIDAFIGARLSEVGLDMNPEADRRTLMRRVSLDLTGLPPRPEEVEAFVQDTAPYAYERLVGRLLASPHWGEHRGRYWLDAARYADTHGLHFDNYREMWPYRDWVTSAFNQNQPFDQFVIDQLAGDLLEEPTDDQWVATGFQRCNITTNEGGTIEEENLALYANDRVSTTGWVFLGLTANCSACHDHKFDPITQKDFYSLAAFYRNTAQSGFDRNWRESDVYRVSPVTEDDRRRWRELPGEIEEAEGALAALDAEIDAALAGGTEAEMKAEGEEELAALKARREGGYLLGDEQWQLPLREEHPVVTGLRAEGREHSVRIPGGLVWRSDGPLGPAPVFTREHALDLGDRGRLDQGDPWTVTAWVRIPEGYDKDGALIARMTDAEGHYRGWDVFVNRRSVGLHIVHRWPQVALKVRSPDDALTPGTWHSLSVSYDGSGRASGVRLHVDGTRVAGRAEQDRLEGTVVVDLPLRVGRREKDSFLEGVAVQDLRLFPRVLEPAEVRTLAAAPTWDVGRKSWVSLQAQLAEVRTARDVFQTAAETASKETAEGTEPTEEERQELEKRKREREQERKRLEEAVREVEAEMAMVRDAYRMTEHPTAREAIRRVALLKAERDRIRGRSPVAHIQRERSDVEPMARLLERGAYDRPGEALKADTPGFLPPMPEGAPRNRLGLAQWLVMPENPLFARVTVNRFWQELFGTGLVRTTEDFGTVGETPSHPELLDWLAVEFRESGWDVKRLFTLMVTSAAYRQSAAASAEKLEKDRDNRWLSRGPRFRMDAEMIRDYALTASGLLVPKLGGPSVKPYQPEGVWEAVAMPESNTRHYERDSGDALYRRSMYTFWKRAAPPATLDVLNAPSREVCTVRRERTNTPLQALATLNDPTFVEAARVLAERMLREADGCSETALAHLSRRVLLRPLTAEEQEVVGTTHARMQAHYEAVPEDAVRLLGVGEAPCDPRLEAASVAALAMVANQLLNLDETLNK